MCSAEKCKRKVKAKGLCGMHWLRQYRYGRLHRIEKDWKGKPRKYGYKSIKFMHLARFGGLREQVIQRDGEKCVGCGMTRQEHRDRWDRDITVDHIDKQGRYVKEQNNTLQNMQTMCLPCHSRKDAKLQFGIGGI